jgi:hypothetical protein
MITCCLRKPKELEVTHPNPVFTPVHASPGHLDLRQVLLQELEIGRTVEIPDPILDPNKKA